MKQTLYRRIGLLENINEAALRQRGPVPADEQKLEELWQRVQAWHAVPANQQWLAEQPEDYLHDSIQKLKAELAERAYGHCAGVAA